MQLKKQFNILKPLSRRYNSEKMLQDMFIFLNFIFKKGFAMLCGFTISEYIRKEDYRLRVMKLQEVT